jgi:hypothetical protein
MKLFFASLFILGGLALALPMAILWNALQIQIGLGDYALATKMSLSAVAGVVCLLIGWQLFKTS